MSLQLGQQGVEHGLAGGGVRLRHVHRLEAPLQRGVLFDVLAVLVGGGRAYHLYLASAERGLEYIRRVQRALGRACADYGVYLVDEDYDVACARHLAQHALDAVFKVAAVLCPGQHGGYVQRDYAAVLQLGGHVAAGHAPGQGFGDGGLAHARLADQDGVIFAAAG